MTNNLYISTENNTGGNPTLTTGTIGYFDWFPRTKKELRPDKIIFHDRTTIVIWNDGTKTKSTCSENDIFDEQIGLSACLLKKMYGKKVHGKKLFERMLASAERHNMSKTSGGSHAEDIVENISGYSKKLQKFSRRGTLASE